MKFDVPSAARQLATQAAAGAALKEAERAVALARTPEDRRRAEELVAFLKRSPE
jgi:hypothetical protein